MGCERRGEIRRPGMGPETADKRITHPRVSRVGRIRPRRFASAEQQSCVRRAILLLLLFFANVRDDHFDLIRGHSLVREGMHGFLVFAAVGDHVS